VAVLLGTVFLQPRNIRFTWQQVIRGQSDQLWDLHATPKVAALRKKISYRDVGSVELAVLVGLARSTDEIQEDFAASQAAFLPFRAVLEIGNANGGKYHLADAGEALGAAHFIIDQIRTAKAELGGIRTIHLFLAVPAGVAMMVGQLLNGLPEVQLYEHVPGASPGPYRPAIKLNPSL
jgi:hypothetical protein